MKVIDIKSTTNSFGSLQEDGSVICWGGNEPEIYKRNVNHLRSGVKQLFANDFAFAVIKSDGSAMSWGSPFFGGNSTGVKDQISADVIDIRSTEGAFAALKSDGSVVT